MSNIIGFFLCSFYLACKNLYKRSVLPFAFLIAAAVITVFITEYNGDKWEQPVRSALYWLTRDSIPEYSSEITDGNGIPYVNYKTLNGITPGKQYNPTIVCNYAIRYYEKLQKKNDCTLLLKFNNCAEWLAENLQVKDSTAFYRFNWQQPWYDSVGVPYTSGMTSGMAIKVFTLAYLLTKQNEYITYAKMLMRGFYVPIHSGGFTYKDLCGWWYEELADKAMHTPRILDGHIFAITGLQAYVQLTNNDSGAFLISKGIDALKSGLRFYDAGKGWSYYDKYQLPADRKYHRILTAQMKELYGITSDPFFLAYYDKWNVSLSRLYVRRVVEDLNISGIMLVIAIWAFHFVVLFRVWKKAAAIRKA